MGTTPDPIRMVSTSRNATASIVSRSGSKGSWAIQTLRKPSSRIAARLDTKASIGDVPLVLVTSPTMVRLICMLSIESLEHTDLHDIHDPCDSGADPARELRAELVRIGDGHRDRRDGGGDAADPRTRTARVLHGGLGSGRRPAGCP